MCQLISDHAACNHTSDLYRTYLDIPSAPFADRNPYRYPNIAANRDIYAIPFCDHNIYTHFDIDTRTPMVRARTGTSDNPDPALSSY